MKKTLYSLMLSDDVMREIDRLAHRLGTNRSNLVNQILAEKVEVNTPEKRVKDIFRAIEEFMSSEEIIPLFEPNGLSMSLRTCLEYKYRPTVRYSVTLTGIGDRSIGELSVIYRTQSPALIEVMAVFFGLWKQLEEKYLMNRETEYSLYEGRFTRSLCRPAVRYGNTELSASELAEAISGYIKAFDRLMKAYICENADIADIERGYVSFIDSSRILI